MKKSLLFKMMNIWPPYLGAGIRVSLVSPDITAIDVEMKLNVFNRNFVGTHYGGSLYSMTDPFYMLMLIEHLGREYIVWDKAANIKFKKPGQGKVRAEFRISKEEIDLIKAGADREDKFEPVFNVQVIDESGSVVAEVEKILYVKRKDKLKTKDS